MTCSEEADMPDQSQLRKAAEIQRMFLDGQVSHQTAQQRLTWTGYRLNDPALAAELRRQDETERAEAEAADARSRRQDAKVNRYLREQYEASKGITIDGF
jgi:hypothetical protein